VNWEQREKQERADIFQQLAVKLSYLAVIVSAVMVGCVSVMEGVL
jgi:hypothetical protein